MKLDDLMTLSEAAEALGVAHATLTKQAKLGRLKATKRGNLYLVTKTEVERYREWSRGRPGRKSKGEK